MRNVPKGAAAMPNPFSPRTFSEEEQGFLRTASNPRGAYPFPPAPDDFDPRYANVSELAKHGLYWPAAADANSAFKRARERIFSRRWSAKDVIVPKCEPQVGR